MITESMHYIEGVDAAWNGGGRYGVISYLKCVKDSGACEFRSHPEYPALFQHFRFSDGSKYEIGNNYVFHCVGKVSGFECNTDCTQCRIGFNSIDHIISLEGIKKGDD